ncbi:hypothetical protein DPMN_044996 [Dreissena polymorpha]|uniref:Uncharacterized protein n=1 Tax=Dreissena polymorpha TaxID=45954 RepID=A0A9D4D402_DREPO|nr:hypothetical protein DPMN_044996 [Dreissena polymorpha]
MPTTYIKQNAFHLPNMQVIAGKVEREICKILGQRRIEVPPAPYGTYSACPTTNLTAQPNDERTHARLLPSPTTGLQERCKPLQQCYKCDDKCDYVTSF